MSIIGILILIVSGALTLAYRAKKKKLAIMEATETSLAADLKNLSDGIAEEIGPGSFYQETEVKGRVTAVEPLTSELGELECVHYQMSVHHVFEETYYEQNQRGERVRRTRQSSTKVADNSRTVPFYVEDRSGSIRIEPDGAEIIAQKVVSRFEQGRGRGMSVGRFHLDLSRSYSDSGRRTLGYRFEESAIPLNRDIYVLGAATDRRGEVCIEAPQNKGKFIISVKGEEVLLKETQSAMKTNLVLAVIFAIVGAGVLIYGFVGG